MPPPAALAPDAIPPHGPAGRVELRRLRALRLPRPVDRRQPRTPRRDHVSHPVYDHTSILALIERKWNLPALTYRDANANDLTDFLDLQRMAAGNPTFPELPALPPPGDERPDARLRQDRPGPDPAAFAGGPRAGTPGHPAIRVELRNLGVRRHRHGLLLELRTSHGALTGLEVELHHGRHRVTRVALHKLTTHEHPLVLRVHGRAPKAGRYTVVVRQGKHALLRRAVGSGELRRQIVSTSVACDPRDALSVMLFETVRPAVDFSDTVA